MKKDKRFAYRYTGDTKQKIYGDSRLDVGIPLPNTPYLSIMVWNIFKQQRLDWLSILEEYSKGKQLVLLQEAQSSQSLIDFATKHYLVADQVPAIKMPSMDAGVMTLAATCPIYCLPFRKAEPLLRLPKSALITVYPLFDTQLLMVVNIHAVNFSLGVDIYQQQIKSIAEHVMLHNGPVIFAGDFNTWSRARLYILYTFARKMGLKPVHFEDDQRKSVFNLPLDFIFYRGLTVHTAKIISTKASDHNPLLVSFKINPNKN